LEVLRSSRAKYDITPPFVKIKILILVVIQERRIIILSTVRSSTDYVQYDIKHHLGFVADPRRLNGKRSPRVLISILATRHIFLVAITRAQALLIVVGNPIVLSLDPVWRAFMNYVHLNKGWRGKQIDWDPGEPIYEDGGYDRQRREQAEGDADDMVMRLKSLILDNTDLGMLGMSEGGSDSDGEGYVEGVWREEE
jgi:helicase MOV-10